jgi:hypothetical protein
MLKGENLVSSTTEKKIIVIVTLKLTYCLVITLLMLPKGLAQSAEGLLLNASVLTGYDDNVLRRSIASSDRMIKFLPELKLKSLYGKHQFYFGYNGGFTSYSDNSSLNYDDHNLSLRALFDHSRRFNSELQLTYQDKIEQPGTTNAYSTLVTNEFNQFSNKNALARFLYGSRKSIGQFVLAFDVDDREYSNNQQEFRNVERKRLIGTMFYNLGLKTRVLFEARVAAFDYTPELQIADQSNHEDTYFAGVEWQVTAKTSGIFKIGYQSKDFENQQFSDVTGLSYILNMDWSPYSYTKINVGARRETKESAELGVGGFLDTSYSIMISHEMSANTEFFASYFSSKEDINPSLSRTDRRAKINLGIAYRLNSWLTVELDYRHQKRESDIELLEFSSNAVELSFSSTFK